MRKNDEKIIDDVLLIKTFRTVIASIEGATADIKKMFEELGIIDYVFIGGLGTIYHGYIRTTEDIDIILSSKDFDEIFNDLDRLINYGFEAEDAGIIRHKDGTKIEFLVEEGYFLQDPERQVPKLSELPRDKNHNFTDFETHLKLKSNRGAIQDIADITILLKNKALSEEEIYSILQRMDERQKKNFKKALQALKEEDVRYKDLKI